MCRLKAFGFGMKVYGMLVAILCFSVRILLAQELPLKVLDRVSKNYKSFKTVRASFDYTVLDKNMNKLAGSEAKLQLDIRSGKYHIVMDDREIISDAKTQWQVMKDVGEVQISDADSDPDQLTPANVFTFYKTGYGYTALPDEKEGGKLFYAIRLDPQDKSKPIRYVKLRIDKVTNLIKDVSVFDKSGGSFSYRVQKFEKNIALPAAAFTFDKADYKGMEIVDLR
ncbi:Outer membrane lipoprotein-sorting protein [bacterium A37T11]|nr:Outer membrane lipoprotein-sorting protein [bacterium A37T11]